MSDWDGRESCEWCEELLVEQDCRWHLSDTLGVLPDSPVSVEKIEVPQDQGGGVYTIGLHERCGERSRKHRKDVLEQRRLKAREELRDSIAAMARDIWVRHRDVSLVAMAFARACDWHRESAKLSELSVDALIAEREQQSEKAV